MEYTSGLMFGIAKNFLIKRKSKKSKWPQIIIRKPVFPTLLNDNIEIKRSESTTGQDIIRTLRHLSSSSLVRFGQKLYYFYFSTQLSICGWFIMALGKMCTFYVVYYDSTTCFPPIIVGARWCQPTSRRRKAKTLQKNKVTKSTLIG